MLEVGLSCLPCLFSTFSFSQGLLLNLEQSTCSMGWQHTPVTHQHCPLQRWIAGEHGYSLVICGCWESSIRPLCLCGRACVFLTEHLPGSAWLFLFSAVLAKTLKCHLAQCYCFPSLGDNLSPGATASTSNRSASALSPVRGVMNTDVRCSLPLLLAG